MKRNYKQEYLELRKRARQKGIKVKTNWKNRTWRGMNPNAAKSLKVKCPRKTVLLSTSENTYKEKAETTRHELYEMRKMNRGLSYRQAHKYASLVENNKTSKV